MIRQAMIETTDMAAVAYLGYFYGEYDDLGWYLEEYGLCEDHPFIADIPEENYIEHDGHDLYCIVPLDENAYVAVYDWIVSEENDYMGEVGSVIYESGNGAPFLIRGNVSEIVPNMLVEVIDSNGNTLEYTPGISMMDGTLLKNYEPPTIMDFTPYEAFSTGFGYEYGFTVDELTAEGDWTASVYTLNSDTVETAFYFDEYGNMEFCYSVEEGRPFEVFYEGYYYDAEDDTLPENSFIFELELVEDNSAEQIARPEIYTAVSFEKSPEEICIYMTYEEGDLLIDNEDNGYFYVLFPTVG